MKYEFEVSEDHARTGPDGKPVFPDVISVALHKKYAWRVITDILTQLADDEEWILVYLPGALETRTGQDDPPEPPPPDHKPGGIPFMHLGRI